MEDYLRQHEASFPASEYFRFYGLQLEHMDLSKPEAIVMHPASEKMQEFERCPFGIIGLETALALALEEWVAPGRISLSRLVELFTTGPDSVMRLGRGTMALGAPIDITVFSTDVEWTYDVNQSASRSRNSPFHGRTFRGGPMATVVDGEFKWRR